MQVDWQLCSEGLPPYGYPVVCLADYEQLWGMGTLTDGTACHSEDYWWLESQQESLAQMFVTHWTEVDWPDLPQREGGNDA